MVRVYGADCVRYFRCIHLINTTHMKKLSFVLFVSFLSATTVQSQIKQGALFLGGNFSVSSEKRDNHSNFTSTQSGVGFSPVIGYAIKDDIVIGGDLYYSDSKYDATPPAYDNKNSYRGIGFFVRHYHQIKNSGFSLFVQGRIGYEHYRFTQTGTAQIDDLKRNEVRTTFNPGLSYQVSKRWQLETGLNNFLSLSVYNQKQTISAGSPSNTTTKGVNLQANLNPVTDLYIGLRFLLNK